MMEPLADRRGGQTDSTTSVYSTKECCCVCAVVIVLPLPLLLITNTEITAVCVAEMFAAALSQPKPERSACAAVLQSH